MLGFQTTKKILLKDMVKIKNTVPWAYVISDLNGESLAGSFYEQNLQKTSQEKLRKGKVLKRKGDKLHAK